MREAFNFFDLLINAMQAKNDIFKHDYTYIHSLYNILTLRFSQKMLLQEGVQLQRVIN